MFMTEFEKSHWSERGHGEKYLDTADLVVVERERLLWMLGSFYSHFLGRGKKNRVLDLGCGDGVLTRALVDLDGTIDATLVDGSGDMLDRARERLEGFGHARFIRATFQELIKDEVELSGFDLVVSSLAIHHLEAGDKRALFRCIYSALKERGYFVNIDMVVSPSRVMEEWHIRLWQEWMAERKAALKIDSDYNYFVERYTAKDHYEKIEPLRDQMEALRAAGFNDVECHFKYGIFAMYGGRK